MNAREQRQKYPLRQGSAFVKVREVIHFARWLGRRLNHEIYVEGVTSVRTVGNGVSLTAPPLSTDTATRTMSITPPRKEFTFGQKRGLARRAVLRDYAVFLEEALAPPVLRSTNLTESRNLPENNRVAFEAPVFP